LHKIDFETTHTEYIRLSYTIARRDTIFFSLYVYYIKGRGIKDYRLQCAFFVFWFLRLTGADTTRTGSMAQLPLYRWTVMTITTTQLIIFYYNCLITTSDDCGDDVVSPDGHPESTGPVGRWMGVWSRRGTRCNNTWKPSRNWCLTRAHRRHSVYELLIGTLIGTQNADRSPATLQSTAAIRWATNISRAQEDRTPIFVDENISLQIKINTWRYPNRSRKMCRVLVTCILFQELMFYV